MVAYKHKNNIIVLFTEEGGCKEKERERDQAAVISDL